MKERKCANKEIVEVWDKTFECPVFCVIWQQMLFSVNWVYVEVLVLQQILYTLAAVNSLRFKLGAKWQIETKYYSLFWRDDLCSIPGSSDRIDCSHQKERPLASCRWLQEYSIVHSRPIMFFSYFLLLQAEPWSLWWGERSSVQLPSHDHSSSWQVAMITVVKAMMVLLIVDEGLRREAWSLTKPSAKHLCVDPVGRLFWPAGGGIIIISTMLKLWSQKVLVIWWQILMKARHDKGSWERRQI